MTSCCAGIGVEDHELHLLYWDPEDLSRSLSLFDDSSCPFCHTETWDFAPFSDSQEVPGAWAWALSSEQGGG